MKEERMMDKVEEIIYREVADVIDSDVPDAAKQIRQQIGREIKREALQYAPTYAKVIVKVADKVCQLEEE